MLTILSHLLRGESVIENYLKSQKDLPSTSGSSAAPISPRQSRFLAALASVAVTGGPSTSAAGSASAPGPAPPRAPITVSGPTSAAVVPAVSIPMADVAALAAAANAAPAVDDLPEEANVFITSLTDMGFTREMALEALLNVGPDVVAATDWLLNQPDRAQVWTFCLGIFCVSFSTHISKTGGNWKLSLSIVSLARPPVTHCAIVKQLDNSISRI